MQLERFKARKAVREAKQSGICENRFDDRSRECRVLAKGARLAAVIEVRLLSARLRCFRNLHFDDGNMHIDSRLTSCRVGCANFLTCWNVNYQTQIV